MEVIAYTRFSYLHMFAHQGMKGLNLKLERVKNGQSQQTITQKLGPRGVCTVHSLRFASAQLISMAYYSGSETWCLYAHVMEQRVRMPILRTLQRANCERERWTDALHN